MPPGAANNDAATESTAASRARRPGGRPGDVPLRASSRRTRCAARPRRRAGSFPRRTIPGHAERSGRDRRRVGSLGVQVHCEVSGANQSATRVITSSPLGRRRKTSTSGIFAFAPDCSTSVNSGDSVMAGRTHSPTATSAPESRNGTRHPRRGTPTPGEEPDGVRGEGQRGARQRLELREEQPPEDQGGGGSVEEEVVPLQGRPIRPAMITLRGDDRVSE